MINIFFTVGTQEHNFKRLLNHANKIENANITVQKGYSKLKLNKDIKVFEFHDNIEQFIIENDIIISHGGIATIILALKHQKKLIVMPRKKKYAEHVNDHQEEITNKFSKNNYLYLLNQNDNINYIIDKVVKMSFKQYKFDDNNNLFSDIEKRIK